MWHVETDFFALAVFLIMLIKEHSQRKNKEDTQGTAFYLVLIFSIVNDVIDIISSLAMNYITDWWAYEVLMTIYVASMPLLAAVWVSYTYVLIHKHDFPQKKLLRNIAGLMVPYGIYILLALSNPATGWFFRLSPDIEYSRGPLFMSLGVGSIMFYSALGLLLGMVNYKHIVPKTHGILVMAFFVVTAIFIWVQLANPGWLIINASYAVVYVWCDITVEEQRRRELYQELNLKNRELEVVAREAESAAQAKTEFLSRMSHDIRTPMNAIMGLTHLAQEEEDIRRIREYLHNIEVSTNFLLGLINDILDMSKIEHGDLKLKEDIFAREEFENSINTVIGPLMKEKNINFVFRMPENVDCIRVDRLRFSQIFFNLLSNAAKFTPTGGTVEFIGKKIGQEENHVILCLWVKDDGIGMSEEFLEHLYDPFSQERSAIGDTVKGTGLGLPIVKSLVDIMGGEISVKSQLGKGTKFTVKLKVPLAKKDEQTSQAEESVENLKDARILLVEDNEINIYVAQLILEKAGCLVEVARDGKEAVEKFENSDAGYYQVILMDVRMPVMNGIEATRAIRGLQRADAGTVPVIAMTADAFDEERKQTLGAGMNQHLSKPINPQLLYSVLSGYLKRG